MNYAYNKGKYANQTIEPYVFLIYNDKIRETTHTFR